MDTYSEYECDDPTIADEFDLDALSDGMDLELPENIAALVSQIDRRQCYHTRIVQLQDGQFFLRWKEAHPEMVPIRDCLDRDWIDKLAEYRQLEDVLPPKEFELPMSRQEAFALIAALYLPDEFQSDVSALLA